MHPFKVSTELQAHGFWYTYWLLRNHYPYDRYDALWLIWIGWNVNRHLDKLHEECGGFIDSEVAQ